MKKLLAILLAVMLLMTGALAETAEANVEAPETEAPEANEAGTDEARHEINRYIVKTYLTSLDYSYDLPLCFVDGVDDLPWLDLEDFCQFMNVFEQQFYEDSGYRLVYEVNGEQVWLCRESNYFMIVDFEQNTIAFTDYDAFIHDSSSNALVDLVSGTGYDAEGRGELFRHVPTGSYDRYGESVLLELDDYGIQLIHQGDYYLVPAQTLSDFVLSIGTGLNLFYNGEEAFCANADSFGMVDSQYYPLTELGERYYSGKPSQRSEALANYGYNELCLMLDNLYGLKELHDVKHFDRLFTQLAYKDDLLSPDPETADNQLYDFIDLQLDDIHSTFSGYSFMTGMKATEGSYGIQSINLNGSYAYYGGARSEHYSDGPVGYEEVGNTAYVTFDEFTNKAAAYYYECLENGEDLPEGDTIGLIIKAHQQINREGSPVENVVIDLSNNGGGTLNAAAFVIAWALGEAQVSLKDTFTGAMSTAVYQVDANLDREFDDNDKLTGKKIYCLISPCSFSCGNFVPAVFKSSGRVTLLGRTSGGGSCFVLNAATAWGTYFSISGPQRMSLMKNGAFYDIDQGVEPDFIINNVDNFYDREALTAYINGLF